MYAAAVDAVMAAPAGATGTESMQSAGLDYDLVDYASHIKGGHTDSLLSYFI